MELTHEHIKRAYSIKGFENCGRFLTEQEHKDVLELAKHLSMKKRRFQ